MSDRTVCDHGKQGECSQCDTEAAAFRWPYQARIDKLTAELGKVTAERDELKEKLSRYEGAVEVEGEVDIENDGTGYTLLELPAHLIGQRVTCWVKGE